MNKIIKFNSKKEFSAYIHSKIEDELGSGSEGFCYYGIDGLAYKDLSCGLGIIEYVPEDIITTTEVQSDSFYFPHVLFVVGDKLMGYTSNVVEQDLTNMYYLRDNGVDHIDFDKLYEAYEVLKKDALQLAEQGINIYDLSYNLLFDGEKLVGIDTCGYYRTNEIDSKHNIMCVDNAVKDLFVLYAYYEYGDNLDTTMDVRTFLETVKKNYASSDTIEPYVKK